MVVDGVPVRYFALDDYQLFGARFIRANGVHPFRRPTRILSIGKDCSVCRWMSLVRLCGAIGPLGILVSCNCEDRGWLGNIMPLNISSRWCEICYWRYPLPVTWSVNIIISEYHPGKRPVMEQLDDGWPWDISLSNLCSYVLEFIGWM